MNFQMILLIILFSLILFFLMLYLKNKKITLKDLILIPNIYIIFLASLITSLKDYTLLIIIFYLIFDLINFLVNPKIKIQISIKKYLKTLFLTFLISILSFNFFILKVKDTFVDMEIFKNFLWLLIIYYFYQKLNNLIYLKKEEDKNFEIDYQEYIIMTYAKYKNKYHYLIKSKNLIIENIIYSFLIYETYNHPSYYQVIKNIKNKILKGRKTYGILEIESDHYISEEESISILKEKLENKEKRIKKTNQEELLKKLIKEKYKETKIILEILNIYNIILEFNQKN